MFSTRGWIVGKPIAYYIVGFNNVIKSFLDIFPSRIGSTCINVNIYCKYSLCANISPAYFMQWVVFHLLYMYVDRGNQIGFYSFTYTQGVNSPITCQECRSEYLYKIYHFDIGLLQIIELYKFYENVYLTKYWWKEYKLVHMWCDQGKLAEDGQIQFS